MSTQDVFDLYQSANTQADLSNRQGGVHEDFGSFLRETPTEPSTVDVTGISNSTPAKQDFLRFAMSTRFHVVFGSFGSNPYGPGNNILFKFDQPSNTLRMVRITQPEGSHTLGSTMNVSSKSVSFTGGDLDIVLRETDKTYTRQSGGNGGEPAKVYNLQAKSPTSDNVTYNYFVVPY